MNKVENWLLRGGVAGALALAGYVAVRQPEPDPQVARLGQRMTKVEAGVQDAKHLFCYENNMRHTNQRPLRTDECEQSIKDIVVYQSAIPTATPIPPIFATQTAYAATRRAGASPTRIPEARRGGN